MLITQWVLMKARCPHIHNPCNVELKALVCTCFIQRYDTMTKQRKSMATTLHVQEPE